MIFFCPLEFFFSQSSGIFLTTKIELLGAPNICSGEEVMARKGQEEVGTVQRAAYCGGQVKLPQLSQHHCGKQGFALLGCLLFSFSFLLCVRPYFLFYEGPGAPF